MNDFVCVENSNSSYETEYVDYTSEEEECLLVGASRLCPKTHMRVDNSSDESIGLIGGAVRAGPHAGSSEGRDTGHLVAEGIGRGRVDSIEDEVVEADDESVDDLNSLQSKKRCKKNAIVKTKRKRHCETLDVHCKLGEYVTKEYELLRLILSYLPNKDLKNASQVCRNWMSVANIIKKSRTKVNCLFWRQHAGGHSLLTFLRRMFRENVFIEPKFSLTFLGQKTYSGVSNVPAHSIGAQRWYYGSGTLQGLCGHLEEDCTLICIQGHGVVGTTHHTGRVLEIENNFPALATLLLPNIPGVNVTCFQLDDRQCSQLGKQDSLSDDKLVQLTGISLSEPIRCLLLFCTMKTTSGNAILTLVNSIQSRQDIQMAVGGGIMDSCRFVIKKQPAYNPECMRGKFIVGVAFSGPNVSATSTILNDSVKDESQIEKVLDKFKQIQEPTCYQSIGLMFACLGRGLFWYNSNHVESRMFQRSFPGMPIIGYFGNGEIGVDCCSDKKGKISGSKTPRDRFLVTRKSVIHTYTTVFVRLCFKNTRV